MTWVAVSVPAECELRAIEDVLWDVFNRARSALEQGASVVLVVDDDALAGNAAPAASAAAAAALGLARALAMEGAKLAWWINVLAVPSTAAREDIDAWVERLGEPRGASGTVLRLGTRHHGRLPL